MGGKRIGDAQKEYEALITTRVRQLERPLNKIEELRGPSGRYPRPPKMTKAFFLQKKAFSDRGVVYGTIEEEFLCFRGKPVCIRG